MTKTMTLTVENFVGVGDYFLYVCYIPNSLAMPHL